MADATLVPPWLEQLLSTEFFSICPIHTATSKSECNMFCLDCNGGNAFCFYCRSSNHKNHQIIQIRRSSYHDVVRVSETQRLFDINGVQTYVINGARVLFLNQRPQTKSGKVASHVCEICGRSLLDPLRFCSLGCKLLRIKRNKDASFMLDATNEEEMQEGERELSRGESSAPTIASSSASGEEEGGSQRVSNARKRKGIPHRAPFGSYSYY